MIFETMLLAGLSSLSRVNAPSAQYQRPASTF